MSADSQDLIRVHGARINNLKDAQERMGADARSTVGTAAYVGA